MTEAEFTWWESLSLNDLMIRKRRLLNGRAQWRNADFCLAEDRWICVYDHSQAVFGCFSGLLCCWTSERHDVAAMWYLEPPSYFTSGLILLAMCLTSYDPWPFREHASWRSCLKPCLRDNTVTRKETVPPHTQTHTPVLVTSSPP